MLNVRFDPARPYDQGQFYIERVEIDHQQPQVSRRFGYWCDRAHLKTCAVAVLAHFGGEMAKAMLD